MTKSRGCTSGRTVAPADLSETDRKRFLRFLPDRPREGCHCWRGGSFPGGYGSFWLNGQSHRAHRIAYVLAHDQPLLAEALVCHACDHPPCCNPEHLFLGSPSDNGIDMVAKGRWYYVPRDQPRGEQVKNHKLTEADVIELRRLLREGPQSTRALAIRFGISGPLVRYIGVGKAWAHVPGALTPEEYRQSVRIGRPPSP